MFAQPSPGFHLGLPCPLFPGPFFLILQSRLRPRDAWLGCGPALHALGPGPPWELPCPGPGQHRCLQLR